MHDKFFKSTVTIFCISVMIMTILSKIGNNDNYPIGVTKQFCPKGSDVFILMNMQ
jgi:hypothetical protein